jgi:hypothetical protein
LEDLDLEFESPNLELEDVDLSKTEVQVNFGALNVFRREVQVKKTAFEGSVEVKQVFETEVEGSGDDVDVLLETLTSTERRSRASAKRSRSFWRRRGLPEGVEVIS